MRQTAVADLTPVARRKGWDRILDELDPVIARRDPAVEPVEILPSR